MNRRAANAIVGGLLAFGATTVLLGQSVVAYAIK